MHGWVKDGVGWVGQAEWMHPSGIKLSLDKAVEAWRVRRDKSSSAPLSGTLDRLRRIADLGCAVVVLLA